jgi:putative DNA primase/helicase
MNFAQFCAAHGLIIRTISMTAPGQTKRCATTCNPGKLNGWYRYDGLGGVCGIWGSLDAQQYRPGADAKPLTKADFDAIAAKVRRAEAERAQNQSSAAKRAVALLAASDPRSHAYLSRKGFPDLLAPCVADGAMLLVTMWKDGKVVNLQRINQAGEKRFMSGGEVSGTAHVIGSQGVAILCEGYATCLSVAAAIKASKMRAHAVCCFSADNMVKVAATYNDARIVADNDNLRTGTGEKAAKIAGFPYFLPPIDGQDFNDLHRALGLFSASQIVRTLVLSK